MGGSYDDGRWSIQLVVYDRTIDDDATVDNNTGKRRRRVWTLGTQQRQRTDKSLNTERWTRWSGVVFTEKPNLSIWIYDPQTDPDRERETWWCGIQRQVEMQFDNFIHHPLGGFSRLGGGIPQFLCPSFVNLFLLQSNWLIPSSSHLLRGNEGRP